MKELTRLISCFLVLTVMVLTFSSCSSSSGTVASNGDVYIFNFGDYMSEEAIEIFESETGIRVHEDVFEANEEALPVVENGAEYDVICISDYMIERMLGKGLLMELDKSKLPNLVNINKDKLDALSVCDPGNKVAVPYFCGEMGIMYNRDILDELGVPYPTKWADLWNPALKGELLMQSSIRDLYTVGLMKNGFSPNTRDENEINIATEDFIAQKPYVQAYMCDQAKDKILSGEAAIAPIVSGDVQYVYVEGGEGNYTFVVPEEGTCAFIDAWCILKNAKNIDNAYKFIDYMCREDVAKKNAEYIGYESVNDKTPDKDFLEMMKVENGYFNYCPADKNILERDVEDAIRYYTDGYNRLKAS